MMTNLTQFPPAPAPGAENSRSRRDGALQMLLTQSGRTTSDPQRSGTSYEDVIKAARAGYDGIAAWKGEGDTEYWEYPSAKVHAASSMSTEECEAGACVRFACLRYDQTIGKLFYIDANGMLQSHTLGSGTNAMAHVVACATIDDLEAAFRNATPNDIFVGGLPPSSGIAVTSKAKRGDENIARSKDDFGFYNTPGVMFIDNDHPIGTGDDQFDTYVSVVPALAAASYVYAPSSSAWIHDAASGEVLKAAGGQHYAVPVKNASDIPRALTALHYRLVLASLGRPKITKDGTVHIRSQVDTAMQTSNQPLFQRVSLAPGLVQHKEAHIGSHRGDIFLFDTQLIPDLTPDELRRVSEIELELKASVADPAADARQMWVGKQAVNVARKTNISVERATEILQKVLANGQERSCKDLIPGIQIKFADGWVDVGDLLANPGRYDGKPCADPLEPEYGSGIGVAKFYANDRNGKPMIHSHAHGGQTYVLHPDFSDIDLGGILAQAARAAQPEVGAAEPINWQAKADEYVAENDKGKQQPSPPRFEFVPAGDLVREPQPVEYLVDELIEHPSLMMLFGAPSVGKSFVAVSMAASVATGHPWLGLDVRQGPVFYLAGEGRVGLSRRLRAWEIETGVSLANAPLFVSTLPAQLMDDENAQMVERAINELAANHGSPILIVIDTLARNMGSGDESSNADIGKFVAHIDGMRHRLGCTVQLVHHSGHLETERARGASALPAAMDTSFQMEDKRGRRSLIQKKSKESELAAPIPLTLKEVPIGWKDAKGREITSAVIASADVKDSENQKSKSLTPKQKAAMEALYRAVVTCPVRKEDGDWVGVDVEVWRIEFNRTFTADSQEAKKKAFQRARDDLVRRGLLRVDFNTYFVHHLDEGLVAHQMVTNMTKPGHGT